MLRTVDGIRTSPGSFTQRADRKPNGLSPISKPPNATGRDYAAGLVDIDWSAEARDLHVTFGGLLGFAAGAVSGIEMHFMGLVVGIDVRNPALKVPAAGSIALVPGAWASGS